LKGLLPGILAAADIAAAAEVMAPRTGVPAVVLAIGLGAVLGNLAPRPMREMFAPGLQFFTKKVLKVAIVLLGLKLTADRARDLGGPVLALIASCLVLALVVAAALGRPFGVSRRIALLLGCGTAICGATAVVTIAPLVEAEEDEVAFSIATIFLFNVVALFAFPLLGHAAGLSDLAFAAWAGTAVNDTSAVVATGQAYSEAARTYATAIKLLRTLALVPMAVLVAAFAARAGGAGQRPRVAEIFPWFVVGFAAAAALANLVALPKGLTDPVVRGAGLAVTGVLAAVGLHLDARKVLKSGLRSVALGFAIATVMAATSFALVRLLGVGRG
jgi:uncharacterized integral membrane protein (TIGR00698 family)